MAGRAGEEGVPLLGRRRDTLVWHQRETTALALLFLFSTGANWTEACMGPLKATLLSALHINNTQYGVLSASTQMANTVLPIFAGLWIDQMGAARMAVAATSIVCIGAALAALACHSASFPLLVLARIVQGTGVIVVDTAATKLIVQRARRVGGMGLALSCNFAIDRAAGALSKATAVPIAQSAVAQDVPMSATATFCVAAGISSVSLLASLVYRHFEQPSTVLDTTRTHPSSLAMLKRTLASLPALFVYIAVTQFYQPIAVFNNLSADILRWRGSSPRAAGFLASLGQMTPIFVAPLLGRFFDRHGHRMEFVPLTALLLGTSMGLLAWRRASPLLAMAIFSLGNALNTPPYLCALAVLLKDDATFGCAWGIWKALMQSYQIIMHTTLGRLQDASPGQGYQRVLLVLGLSKVLEVIWGLSYIVLDRLYAGGILAANDTKRRSIEEHQASNAGQSTPHRGRRALLPSRWSTLWAGVHLAATVCAAWYLFLAYYLSA